MKTVKDDRPFHNGANIDATITSPVTLTNNADSKEACTICQQHMLTVHTVVRIFICIPQHTPLHSSTELVYENQCHRTVSQEFHPTQYQAITIYWLLQTSSQNSFIYPPCLVHFPTRRRHRLRLEHAWICALYKFCDDNNNNLHLNLINMQKLSNPSSGVDQS